MGGTGEFTSFLIGPALYCGGALPRKVTGNEAQHDDLVDDVERQREDENLTDALSAVLEHFGAVGRVVEKGPEVGRLAGPRVSFSPREERGHHRCSSSHELHGAADPVDQVLHKAHPDVVHRASPLRGPTVQSRRACAIKGTRPA